MLLRQVIGSDAGPDTNADTADRQTRILAVREPIYKRVPGGGGVLCTGGLRLQPDRHDQDQRGKNKALHFDDSPSTRYRPKKRAPYG